MKTIQKPEKWHVDKVGVVKKLVDSEGKLHAMNEPAYQSATAEIWFQNGKRHGVCQDVFGSKCYYYEGALVPPKYFTRPEDLTLQEILDNPNTEVKRVGLKIYGLDRVEEDKAYKLIDEDAAGQTLFKIGDFMYIKVINGTPEPDGTYKKYFLCVPPTMTKFKEAVAWTFYETASTYKPVHET